jgi:hypothetical protein
LKHAKQQLVIYQLFILVLEEAFRIRRMQSKVAAYKATVENPLAFSNSLRENTQDIKIIGSNKT